MSGKFRRRETRLPRALRRFAARWREVRILIDDEKIISRRPGIPDVVILRSEITDVHEDAQRGLSLRGSSDQSLIRVPTHMAEYAELRDLVAPSRVGNG